jgi:uridine kinase
MVKNNPFLIGVCGNSGSGKSCFVQVLVDLLGPENVLVIHGDDYHKWQRGDEEWSRYTHLNPRANHLDLAAEHLADLKRGNTIYKLEYDHDTGKFVGPYKLKPRQYIIFEGLHAFYTKELQKLIDFKLFIDVDKHLNIHFKLHRDMAERGYSKEQILKSIKAREKDAKKYINPQKKEADLVIHKSPLFKIKEDQRETAIRYSFIHHKKINTVPMAKIFGELFKDKVICNYRNNHYTVKTAMILKKDELASLKNTAKKQYGITLTDNVFSLAQLIAAYNISSYGNKIGKLIYPHRGAIRKANSAPRCKTVKGILQCSLKQSS